MSDAGQRLVEGGRLQVVGQLQTGVGREEPRAQLRGARVEPDPVPVLGVAHPLLLRDTGGGGGG